MAKIKIFGVERDYYKVGEMFTLNQRIYRAELAPNLAPCETCAFKRVRPHPDFGVVWECSAHNVLCMPYSRPDKKKVIFKEV